MRRTSVELQRVGVMGGNMLPEDRPCSQRHIQPQITVPLRVLGLFHVFFLLALHLLFL